MDMQEMAGYGLYAGGSEMLLTSCSAQRLWLKGPVPVCALLFYVLCHHTQNIEHLHIRGM